MENTVETDNAPFSVVMETKASELTQGYPGKSYEGALHRYNPI